MNEKLVVEGYLIGTKEYPSREDETKLGGLALRIKTDPYEENPINDIWATLWMNNEKNYSLYLRHKDIYDSIRTAKPDQYKVKITYHPSFKNPRYKEVDDIEFLNLNEPPKKEFTGFTQKDINEIVTKAKEEAAKLPPIEDKPALKDDYYQRKNIETEGKIRHGVACAFISKGAELNDETKKLIKNWVDFIMRG